jgi:hypothetical protein
MKLELYKIDCFLRVTEHPDKYGQIAGVDYRYDFLLVPGRTRRHADKEYADTPQPFKMHGSVSCRTGEFRNTGKE